MERNRDLLEEQNREYQQSLLADEEKERKIREERQQEEAEEKRLLREEEERRMQEAMKEKRKQVELEAKRKQLSTEPTESNGSTAIVIRLPDGVRLSRRFYRTDHLQAVYDFVDVQTNMLLPDYHLVSSYPRQVFSNHAVTLEEAKLFPQAVLLIQEK